MKLEDGRKKGVKVHATIKSDPSTSMPIPIPIPPYRSTFKSLAIVLVLTVAFAMIVNVGCLAAVPVAQQTPLF